MTLRDRACGCLLGLVAGDAVGTTVEFKLRSSFQPLNDVVGGGPFGLKAGQWSDDTSMALRPGYGLDECSGFDAHDQMERYVRWRRDGYLSSTGYCFDIGVTTSGALRRFQQTGGPFAGSTDPHKPAMAASYAWRRFRSITSPISTRPSTTPPKVRAPRTARRNVSTPAASLRASSCVRCA
ncbi:MAG: ADP-ribosylglycohydrolase family protein, partial [Caldilinea sp.]